MSKIFSMYKTTAHCTVITKTLPGMLDRKLGHASATALQFSIISQHVHKQSLTSIFTNALFWTAEVSWWQCAEATADCEDGARMIVNTQQQDTDWADARHSSRGPRRWSDAVRSRKQRMDIDCAERSASTTRNEMNTRQTSAWRACQLNTHSTPA